MASVTKIPIYGEKTIQYDKKAINSIHQNNLSSKNIYIPQNKHTYHKEKDDILAKRWKNTSFNFIDYISQRQLGITKRVQHMSVCPNVITNRILSSGQMKENVIHLSEMNKVFCSKWINDSQILFGTKCKKVI